MDIRKFFAHLKHDMHRNAATARRGFAAEHQLCVNPAVKQKLETHFQKPITVIRKVAHGKKSDVAVVFEDGTQVRIQNKDGVGDNRGWSADRRAVGIFPLDDAGKTLLTNVCLTHEGERPNVPCPPSLVSELLLGMEPEFVPTHFTHTVFHKETGELESMSIATADAVISALQAIAYPSLVPKRTCVHISPLMYLQRKGGGSHDAHPDDIQLKLKTLPESVMVML